MQRSLRWFWPRAERKLYDEPKRLAEEGLARATREHTGKRGRMVYTITDAGRAALRANGSASPSLPRRPSSRAWSRSSSPMPGSRPQVLASIDRIEAQATTRLEEIVGLAATRPPAFPEREHLSAVGLRLFREQEEATVRWARWARWARDQVEQWPDTTDPGGGTPPRCWPKSPPFRRGVLR